MNNLGSNLLKLPWARVFSFSFASLSHFGCHFIEKRQEKFEIWFDTTLTRACKPIALKDSTVLVIRPWLDSIKSRLDSDSAWNNFGSLWLDALVTLTWQGWLGHITGLECEMTCDCLLLYYSIVPLPWTMRLREKKSFIHLCANKLGLLIRCLEILKINLTRVSSCRLWLESSYSVKWTDSSRINNTVSEQRRNTVIWVPWLKRGRGSFLTTRHYTFFPN